MGRPSFLTREKGADPQTSGKVLSLSSGMVGFDAVAIEVGVAIPRKRLEAAPAGRLESDGNTWSHATDSHADPAEGILTGTQMLDGLD